MENLQALKKPNNEEGLFLKHNSSLVNYISSPAKIKEQKGNVR